MFICVCTLCCVYDACTVLFLNMHVCGCVSVGVLSACPDSIFPRSVPLSTPPCLPLPVSTLMPTPTLTPYPAAVCVCMAEPGSYGAVAEALDHAHSPPRRVAIKQIKNIFTVFETSKRIYREIKLLRSLDHPNVVKIVHIQEPRWVQRACCRSDLGWRDPPLWRGCEG